MLSNTLRLNFCYLKVIHILRARYHPKIIWHKNKLKNKRVCIHKFTQLIMMKMKMKIKNRSHRCNMDRPRSKGLSIMMLLCIKQHLCNIWGSLHEKVKQYWGWLEKKLLLMKKACIWRSSRISHRCIDHFTIFFINFSIVHFSCLKPFVVHWPFFMNCY